MSDDWSKMLQTLKLAIGWKQKIIAKGLIRAKAKCPYCDGYWHGVLAGPKKHLHMYCDGDCKTQVHE